MQNMTDTEFAEWLKSLPRTTHSPDYCQGHNHEELDYSDGNHSAESNGHGASRH